MNHQDHIKNAMTSDRFERVVSQVYSNLVSENINKPTIKPQEVMEYAMTMAYMYAINYDSVLRRHMIQRMRDYEDKQQ